MSIFLKTFNAEFSRFLEDLISILPNEKNIKVAKNSFLAMKKINPKLLMNNYF